jgi:hypothetical protein
LDGALLRHLQQFPSQANGLSRSERQALDLIDRGIQEFHRLFRESQNLEERIFLGDWSFRQYLRGLSSGKHPLLSSDAEPFELTEIGRRVLQGREDQVRVNGINRWLAGVHLREGAPVWRWDESRQTLTP